MAAELKASIGAETTGLKAGLKDAEAQIKKFLDNVVTIGKVGEKLKSIGKDMSIGVTAPIVALSTVALKAFSDLEGVRIAFNRLNDPTLLDNLRKATKGTTSDLQLMQATVRAEKFGLSMNALPTLLEYAGRVAKDTGQEVSYLVDSITTGIGRKSPLILDNLGISASQLKAELGGVSMEAASVAMVTEAVGRIAAKELAKMGKDTKTLSESWLQVKTAVNNSMGKIGEIISKNLDISGIIDKLTGYINSAVSTFENFSPSVQKSILVVAGLVAAVGPLLVVIGSVLAVLPQVVAGFGLVSLALTAMTGPIGLVALALAGLGAVYLSLRDNTKKASDYQEDWAAALSKANVESKKQVSELDKLYKASQNTTLSTKERTEAVEALQKLHPKQFQNIKSEIILNGGAEKSYNSLRNSIINASKARAAGAQLDKNTNELLISQERRKLEITKKLETIYALQAKAKANPNQKNMNVLSAGFGLTAEQQIKTQKEQLNVMIRGYQNEYSVYLDANKTLIDIQKYGAQDLADTTIKGADVITAAEKIKINKIIKVKKEAKEKIIAEEKGFTADQLMGNWALELINSKAKAIQDGIASDIQGIADANLKMEEALAQYNEMLNNKATELLESGIADVAFSIGESLANGGNFLASAASSVLNTLSQFMVMFGKDLIKMGGLSVAYAKLLIAIKNAPIKPFVLVAAGIAAIAIGGILAAQSQKMSGSVGGGVGSGGGSIPSGGGGGSQSYSSSYSSGGSGGAIELFARVSGNDLLLVTERARDKNTRLGG